MIIDYQYSQDKYYEKYLPNCPLECESIRYKTRKSSQNFPSREEYNLFKKNATAYNYYKAAFGLNVTSYEEYRKYFFKLNIFYDTMDYTYVTISPKTTFFGLLANLGGSIGALLGFTLFTFFEALEIVLSIIYILIFKN